MKQSLWSSSGDNLSIVSCCDTGHLVCAPVYQSFAEQIFSVCVQLSSEGRNGAITRTTSVV